MIRSLMLGVVAGTLLFSIPTKTFANTSACSEEKSDEEFIKETNAKLKGISLDLVESLSLLANLFQLERSISCRIVAFRDDVLFSGLTLEMNMDLTYLTGQVLDEKDVVCAPHSLESRKEECLQNPDDRSVICQAARLHKKSQQWLVETQEEAQKRMPKYKFESF